METESETKQIMQKKKKIDILDILKESITLYLKNINFIIFTLLTSLPFFFLMVYFETLFQQTLVDTPRVISTLPFYEFYYTSFIVLLDSSSSTVMSFFSDYLPVLIQLGFIYTVPLHVLEFCSAILTIDLASKIRSQENINTITSLKQMFQNSIDDTSIFKGAFLTSSYILLFSTCLLIAFPWVISYCYSFYSSFGGGYIFFAVICCLAITKLLMVYLEWSGIWNMSLVVSVLDGIHGLGALRVSCFFSSGNQKKGLLLMLVFFVIGFCLRILCVMLGCYKEGGTGIFVQIGVLIVTNTIKWVSCVIYFCDCKEKKLEKKVDVEIGKVQLES